MKRRSKPPPTGEVAGRSPDGEGMPKVTITEWCIDGFFIPSQSPVCTLVPAPPWGEPKNGARLRVRCKSSPGAVLHAPGRPTTDIPRPMGPESVPILRLIQTAPLQTDFPIHPINPTNSKKFIPMPLRHGDVRTIKRYRAYRNRISKSRCEKGCSTLLPPSLVTFLAKQESDTLRLPYAFPYTFTT